MRSVTFDRAKSSKTTGTGRDSPAPAVVEDEQEVGLAFVKHRRGKGFRLSNGFRRERSRQSVGPSVRRSVGPPFLPQPTPQADATPPSATPLRYASATPPLRLRYASATPSLRLRYDPLSPQAPDGQRSAGPPFGDFDASGMGTALINTRGLTNGLSAHDIKRGLANGSIRTAEDGQ